MQKAVVIRVDRYLHTQAHALATKLGMPLTEIVRRGLKRDLRENGMFHVEQLERDKERKETVDLVTALKSFQSAMLDLAEKVDKALDRI